MIIGTVAAPWDVGYWKENVGGFLRQHPQIYKVALLVNQVVRAAMTASMMTLMPYTAGGKFAAGFALSAFYWLTVENLTCSLRFAMPAFAGAVAWEMSKHAVPSLVNGAAFRSLQAFVSVIGATWPVLLYGVVIIALVERDVEHLTGRR